MIAQMSIRVTEGALTNLISEWQDFKKWVWGRKFYVQAILKRMAEEFQNQKCGMICPRVRYFVSNFKSLNTGINKYLI